MLLDIWWIGDRELVGSGKNTWRVAGRMLGKLVYSYWRGVRVLGCRRSREKHLPRRWGRGGGGRGGWYREPQL
jgi:nitric oxide synthase oxygenase domain/subunit